jgi:hypothetical protein
MSYNRVYLRSSRVSKVVDARPLLISTAATRSMPLELEHKFRQAKAAP